METMDTKAVVLIYRNLGRMFLGLSKNYFKNPSKPISYRFFSNIVFLVEIELSSKSMTGFQDSVQLFFIIYAGIFWCAKKIYTILFLIMFPIGKCNVVIFIYEILLLS